MSRNMTELDIPMLAPAGFKAGWSGHSWFAIDNMGIDWQVYTNEENSQLTFSNHLGSGPMTHEEFRALFGNG